MNTAIDNLQPGQQPANNAKPLWAAVAILGAAVLGMGGTLIYQGRPSAPAAQVVAVASAAVAKPVDAATKSTNAADDMVEKPTAAPAKPAPVPAKKVVKPTPKPTPLPAPSVAGAAPVPSPYPAPVPVAVAQICGNCGAVESVTPIERTTKADGPGIGAVGGGVLGAVLGNQVGNGNGKTVATILGAIGGGFAGNEVEKRMKRETVYQVGVRMDDGSRRTVEVAQAPAIGNKVTVDGSTIRSNEGGVYNAPAPVVQRTSQQTPVYQAPTY
ncbi:MAG: glycine zipper 2TM domain-containing protein [Polaromonas sp.]|nr:glycine zipper 2TM domain-containing protein [Polaromonas sp.]